MASVSFLTFVSILFLGYFTRNDEGIPLPFKEICKEDNGQASCWKRLDVWKMLVNNGMPEIDPINIFLKNFSIWFIVYSVAYVLTHVEPQRNLFKPFKFNVNYPNMRLVGMEILRSARGVFITSVYELLVNKYHSSNTLPIINIPDMFQLSPPATDGKAYDLNLAGFFIGTIVIYLWADLHFYWTHRMLHTKWLYKNVHKVHHESYNPDPFSGMLNINQF